MPWEAAMLHHDIRKRPDTARVADLRARIRAAMDAAPAAWTCPERVSDDAMRAPLAVRKAHAISLKLAHMPTDLWRGQLLAGSMTLEEPRLHAGWGFPEYTTASERDEAKAKGITTRSVFGHVVPDYPRLLSQGLHGIVARAEAARPGARDEAEEAFLDSVAVACDGVMRFAARLATRCDSDATLQADPARAAELRRMAANLRAAPAGPAQDFWQALQSVWLLHMVFHATMNGNAIGRLDQYAWPYLERDLQEGRIDLSFAAELVDCFCLKFNERAKTTQEQKTDEREEATPNFRRRTRHYTSSQVGSARDSLDATNHWLQNVIVGGVTPEGEDGTNALTYMLLESYRRHEMTNPLVTVRTHAESPEELLATTCEVLKEGGGMPAIFNDDVLVPALEKLGIPTEDARDYTNDGCWEVVIPGRTDFRFQRLSLMLCLEWALNRGMSRRDPGLGEGADEDSRRRHGEDTGAPRDFTSFDDVWQAFETQLDTMVAAVVERVVHTIDDRGMIAPVPLLSALVDGAIETRRDMTTGGAKFRTFGMLAESAPHAIDSLTAIHKVIYEGREATIGELCDALDADFENHTRLRAKMQAAPKYGNADPDADAMGRRVMDAFTAAVARHAARLPSEMLFPCGVGTFSWYVGIGEGLGTAPDGRLSGEPVSSNFSPALGQDVDGLPGAILSYANMPHGNLPAGGPVDLRLSRKLVEDEVGTARMVALLRSFVATGGAMMTLTVVDAEELKAARREPENHRALRVRMGGWCAYFTMLSEEQQDHQIRRQEGDR
jgi:choline trimethylamine-lyase